MIVAFRSAKGRSFAERKATIPAVNTAPPLKDELRREDHDLMTHE